MNQESWSSASLSFTRLIHVKLSSFGRACLWILKAPMPLFRQSSFLAGVVTLLPDDIVRFYFWAHSGKDFGAGVAVA